MSFGVQLFTLVHVAISLVAIFTGFVVIGGQLAGVRLGRWTNWFLATSVLTNLTGFGFPADRFLPSHALAIVSLVVLAVAIYARSAKHLAGRWRTIYLVTLVVALYVNVFVLVVQLFMRVPALKELAPKQTEWPFAATQLAVLAAFIILGIGTVRRGGDTVIDR